MQVFEALAVGDLLGHHRLPRELSPEINFTHSTFEQAKRAEEVFNQTISTDRPPQNLNPSQQSLGYGVTRHIGTFPRKSSQDWLNKVQRSAVPHASDGLKHGPIPRITRGMFDQAQLNPGVAPRPICLESSDSS